MKYFKQYLGEIFLAGLIAIGGCEPADSQMNFKDTQSRADEIWMQGTQKSPTPKTLLGLSRILITQGRDNEAEFVLKKIIREHPQFAEAYVELSELYMRQRRIEKAVENLEAGLQQVPNDHVIINNLGMCCLIRHDYPGAEQRFRKAAAIAPNNTRYRANTALALGLQGRYEESLSVYKQVLSEKEAHENLAIICDARKDTTRAAAERDIVKAIELREAQAQAGKQPEVEVQVKKDEPQPPAAVSVKTKP